MAQSKKTENVEKISRLICCDRGYDPNHKEPGNCPRIDGRFKDGEPWHYLWRECAPLSRKIIKALGKT